MNLDRQAQKLAMKERMPVQYLDLLWINNRLGSVGLKGGLCDAYVNELWSLERPPTHRIHINEAGRAFVPWCRCEWVGPQFDTYRAADWAAVEHLNEGRRTNA